MTSDTAALGPAEVIPILSNLTADDGASIVGGRATNQGAWFYRYRAPYFEPRHYPVLARAFSLEGGF